MPSYQSLQEERKTFGRNSYLEVSRKRLVEEGVETDFLLVTRGFFEKDGTKRWTRFVTIPDDPDMRAWLAETLKKV